MSSEKGRDSETQRADSRVAMKAPEPRNSGDGGRPPEAARGAGGGISLRAPEGGRPHRRLGLRLPGDKHLLSQARVRVVGRSSSGTLTGGGGASEKAPGPGPGRAREAPGWGTARASGRPAQTPLTPTGVFDSLPSSVRSPADRPAQLPPTRRRRCRGAPRGVAGTQGVPVHPGAFASAFPVLDDVPMCSVTPSGPGPRCHLVRFLLDCLGEAGSLPSSAWPRLLSH